MKHVYRAALAALALFGAIACSQQARQLPSQPQAFGSAELLDFRDVRAVWEVAKDEDSEVFDRAMGIFKDRRFIWETRFTGALAMTEERRQFLAGFDCDIKPPHSLEDFAEIPLDLDRAAVDQLTMDSVVWIRGRVQGIERVPIIAKYITEKRFAIGLHPGYKLAHTREALLGGAGSE